MSDRLFSKIKAQVSIYLISIIVILIVLTFVVINVGKIFKDKTYADNAADAGALAAATVMATGFNYLADKNGMDRGDNLEQAIRDLSRTMGEISGQMAEALNINALLEQAKQPLNYVGLSGLSLAIASAPMVAEAKKILYNIQELYQDWQAYRQEQENSLAHQADLLHGESGTPNNYYNNALVAGYKYNFYNAGIFHRLGKQNSKRFSKFLQEITPETVANGEPKTFFWVDGAARIHTVTAIIEIEPADNWLCETSEDMRAPSEGKHKLATAEADLGDGETTGGKGSHVVGSIFPGTLIDIICDGIGDFNEWLGEDSLLEAIRTTQDMINNLTDSVIKVVKNKRVEGAQETYKQIQDVVHSQTVYSSNFQFHMGGIVKGMRGDVDLLGPSFYPPVQSSALASFNCTQRGKICDKAHPDGARVEFEACLIATQ